jgi:hypothetical protein
MQAKTYNAAKVHFEDWISSYHNEDFVTVP